MESTSNKWDQVQAEIAKRWVCLDEKDIADCKNDLNKLPEKIQRAYEWDFEDAVEDYQRFCDFVLRSLGIDECQYSQEMEGDDYSHPFYNGSIEKNYFPVQNQKI